MKTLRYSVRLAAPILILCAWVAPQMARGAD